MVDTACKRRGRPALKSSSKFFLERGRESFYVFCGKSNCWGLATTEARNEKRRIDFEKSLETWRDWLVSSRAAKNFRRNTGCLAVEFRKKGVREI